MPRKPLKYLTGKRKASRVRDDSNGNLALFSPLGGQPGSIGRLDKAAEIASHPVSASALENAFRRYGVEGEDAFLVLASRYLQVLKVRLPVKSFFPFERGLTILDMVAHDKQLVALLDKIVQSDPLGFELSVWYQYFFGRRFREGSGKFFTPRTVASAMAHLLTVKPSAVIMDPTCGGATFLTEASRCWNAVPCKLVGNDVDKMLVGMAEIILAISTSPHQPFELHCANLFDCGDEFKNYWGTIDYILANPPFSLALERIGIRSKLFDLGYRNSDAIFLDVCLKLLAPGGDMVCLLPHSIIVNSEYQQLRIAVERDWDLCGVITLPEGVFYLTANTSTRADIVHLRKKGDKYRCPSNLYFANAPSVGIPLNLRMNDFGDNSLEMTVGDARIQECLCQRK